MTFWQFFWWFTLCYVIWVGIVLGLRVVWTLFTPPK